MQNQESQTPSNTTDKLYDNPEVAEGKTVKRRFGCGNLYVTINAKDGKVHSVFMRIGKSGGCQRAVLEALGRLATILLEETDGDVEKVIHTLQGIRCDQGGIGPGHMSCADCLANELKKYLPSEGA